MAFLALRLGQGVLYVSGQPRRGDTRTGWRCAAPPGLHDWRCRPSVPGRSRLVGSVIGSFDGWRANLYRLVVRPEYRRRGAARRLVAGVTRRLAGQGARRVCALVERDHPPAMGFWAGVGYGLDPRMARFVRDL